MILPTICTHIGTKLARRLAVQLTVMPYSKYNLKHHSYLVLCPCTSCESLKYVSWRVKQQHLQCDQKLAGFSSKYNASTEHNLAGDAADDYESDETITDILQTAPDEAEGESCLLATDDHNGNDLNCNSESAKFEDPECECSLQSRDAQELQVTEERSDDIDVGVNENYCKSYEDDSKTAKLSLYERSEFTVLETIAAMFDWFSSHPNVSKSALSDMLTLQHSILPINNKLPSTYSAAEKFIEPFLLPIVTYHACINDCILFRKTSRYDYSNLTQCPECGASRYVGVNKQAARRYHYYPLGPQWRRLHGNSTISQLLQSHGAPQDNTKELLVVTDVQDSPNFLACYEKDGIFQGDARGMLVQLSCDGVNPFDDKTAQYSMWPIVLSMLNLLSTIRHLFSNLMLVSIILILQSMFRTVYSHGS